jgi:hypothetical protein
MEEAELTQDTLERMPFGQLFVLATKFGLMDKIANCNNPVDAARILWPLIKPSEINAKDNIFEVVNLAQKDYSQAKKVMSKYVADLKECISKIPIEFCTDYYRKCLQQCDEVESDLNNPKSPLFK